MLFYNLTYFILLLILGIAAYFRNTPGTIETFISGINNQLGNTHKAIKDKFRPPLYKSLECVVDNETAKDEITQFIDKNYDIYKTNHIIDEFGMEISTKFTNNSINHERISLFANFKLLNENKKILNEIMPQFHGKQSILQNIIGTLKNNIDYDGQFIYGKDFKNNTNRIYINYEKDKKYYINGFEWNNSIYKQKEYVSVENKTIIVKKLTELLPEKIFKYFIELFPEDSWKVILERKDIKGGSNSNSYYFSFQTEPLLIHIYDRIKPLLLELYNNEEDIEKWYECYKTELSSISWISFSKKSNNDIELNIYFAKIDPQLSLRLSFNKLKSLGL